MMKTVKYTLPAVLLIALSLGVGSAYAQDETPEAPGGRGGPIGPIGPGTGLLAAYEDDIHQALADALGMSLAEFEAARADGQTLADLAAAQDVDLATLFEVMDAVRSEAITQAVADGTITQAQADWILTHRAATHQAGLRSGVCDGSGPAGLGPKGGPSR